MAAPSGRADRPTAPSTGRATTTTTQAAVARIDALLARTTNARARVYLTDAKDLVQAGNLRATRALIQAAQAISQPAPQTTPRK